MSGSGKVRPIACACGTVRFTKRWRRSSLDFRLTPHFMSSAELGESLSLGPNIIRACHHQRLSASCTIAFCSGVPAASVAQIS